MLSVKYTDREEGSAGQNSRLPSWARPSNSIGLSFHAVTDSSTR